MLDPEQEGESYPVEYDGWLPKGITRAFRKPWGESARGEKGESDVERSDGAHAAGYACNGQQRADQALP